jgi:hypothetical protein
MSRTLRWASRLKLEGAEILYRCPRPERHSNANAHPSLKINTKKNVWRCFSCNAKGTAWALAAFVAGLHSGDKAEVTAWLKERGLLNGATHSSKWGKDRKPVATYTYTSEEASVRIRVGRWAGWRQGTALPSA